MTKTTLARLAFPITATVILILGQFANYAFDLAYDRAAIESGQYLLLLSGQIGHTNSAHLVINLSALWLLWFCFDHALKTHSWFVTCAVSLIMVGLGLYFLNPEVVFYLGFSGALHGLFVAGALASIRRSPILSVALLSSVTIKLSMEFYSNDMTETAALIDAPVIHFAHLYGAIAGLAAWAGLTALSLFRGPTHRSEPTYTTRL